jgi:hypothetical protein
MDHCASVIGDHHIKITLTVNLQLPFGLLKMMEKCVYVCEMLAGTAFFHLVLFKSHQESHGVWEATSSDPNKDKSTEIDGGATSIRRRRTAF